MASVGTCLLFFTIIHFSAGNDCLRLHCESENFGKYGQDSIIECTIKTPEAPNATNIRVSWNKKGSGQGLVAFHNGQHTNEPRFQFPVQNWNEKTMNVSLLVSNTQVTDDGDYVCRVRTDRNGVCRITTSLSVEAHYSAATVSSIPKDIQHRTDVILICNSMGGYPKGRIRWVDGVKIDRTSAAQMESKRMDDGRFNLTSKLSLLKNSVLLPYTCSVYNSNGEKEAETTFDTDFQESSRTEDSKQTTAILAVLLVVASLFTFVFLMRYTYRNWGGNRAGHTPIDQDEEMANFSDHENAKEDHCQGAALFRRVFLYRLSSEEVDDSNMAITSFTPIVHTEQTTNEYRFKFPGAGLFQCSVTGLVFGTTGEGEVLFKIVLWDERLLQPTGRTPAGPLFDIQCPQESIYQLYLRHCDVTPGDDLSVAHIADGMVNFLEPMKVTKTHVVVNVPHLSLFGLTWSLNCFNINPEPIYSQVLLFLRPPSDRLEMKVFLLPINVPVDEVKEKHQEDTYMDTTSECELIPKQRYNLRCPQHEVQPKESLPYRPNKKFGPNFHPTFEVFMNQKTENISLELRGPKDGIVWERPLRVKGPSEPKRTDRTRLSVTDKHVFFTTNRGDLVQKVKNVEAIVDELRSGGFHEEIATNVQAENTPQARMRMIMDSVNTAVLEGALFNALLQHEETLMLELVGEDYFFSSVALLASVCGQTGRT